MISLFAVHIQIFKKKKKKLRSRYISRYQKIKIYVIFKELLLLRSTKINSMNIIQIQYEFHLK